MTPEALEEARLLSQRIGLMRSVLDAAHKGDSAGAMIAFLEDYPLCVNPSDVCSFFAEIKKRIKKELGAAQQEFDSL